MELAKRGGVLKSQETIFSIIAADPASDLFGVATVSGAPAVGKIVPFSGAFAGAMAVQGYTSPYFGVAGMKMLREGRKSEEVLATVLAEDPIRHSRQILVIDSGGSPAAFTGDALPQYAGAVLGDRFAAGGCGLPSEEVIDEAVKVFVESSEELANRFAMTLETAAAHCGENVSCVSAVIRISKDTPFPYLDLRVDRHDSPVAELRALLEKWRERQLSP